MTRSSVSSVSSVTGVAPDKSPLELLRELRGRGKGRSASGGGQAEERATALRASRRDAMFRAGAPDTTDTTDRTSPPARDSALGAAKGSPAHRLEQRWRAAWERARDGFRRQGRDPMPGRVGACAALELAAEEGRTLSAAPTARLRELLRGAYAGEPSAQARCEALAGRDLVRALDQDKAPAPEQADTAEGLLRECRQRGVRLWLAGDDLRMEPGPSRIPARLFERIVARQDSLREALRAAGRA